MVIKKKGKNNNTLDYCSQKNKIINLMAFPYLGSNPITKLIKEASENDTRTLDLKPRYTSKVDSFFIGEKQPNNCSANGLAKLGEGENLTKTIIDYEINNNNKYINTHKIYVKKRPTSNLPMNNIIKYSPNISELFDDNDSNYDQAFSRKESKDFPNENNWINSNKNNAKNDQFHSRKNSFQVDNIFNADVKIEKLNRSTFYSPKKEKDKNEVFLDIPCPLVRKTSFIIQNNSKNFSLIRKSKNIKLSSAYQNKTLASKRKLIERGKEDYSRVSLYENFTHIKPETTLFYTISGGNNAEIVRHIFNRRYYNWREVVPTSLNFHFKWQMISKGIKFDMLSCNHIQIVNHFECHYELSFKDLLQKNIVGYCELNKINVYDFYPLSFILNIGEKTFNADLEKFIQCFCTINEALKKKSINDEFLVTNYINSHLNSHNSSKDRRVICHCKPKLNETQIMNSNLWIIKPTELNRGRGIYLFNDINSLKRLIIDCQNGSERNHINVKTMNKKENFSFKQSSFFKTKTFVIQKYIESPLLIKYRKFDIRVWVLINHNNYVYFFKEGYLRTSSSVFSLETTKIDNKEIHLTNNAIQKSCINYGKYEDGNQLSFNQFQQFLDTNQIKVNVRNDICNQIKEIIGITVQSIRKKINPNEKYLCFELFGYDFIVDSNYKVWLIEVNTNPCLEESSKLLKILIPRMLDDCFRITVDSVYPGSRKVELESQFIDTVIYPVPGYKDSENMWEFVCQIGIQQEKKSSKKHNSSEIP